MTSPVPAPTVHLPYSLSPTLAAATTATVGSPATSPPVQEQAKTTGIQRATLGVAIVAVLATVLAAWWLRRTGKGTVKAAEASAQASRDSAEAARDAVELNRVTARATGERADAEALSKRYQEAASQIGHDKAAVRLAGVYALARLADDWEDERQTCVDVLTAYLRLPWDTANPSKTHDDYHVRSTILSVVERHTRAEFDGPSWSDLRFDFAGATFVDLLLQKCLFKGEVIFDRANFIGVENFFNDVTFAGRASFHGVEVSGGLSLIRSNISGGLSMRKLAQTGEAGFLVLSFSAIGDEIVMLDELTIGGKLVITLPKQNNNAWISLTKGDLAEGGRLSILAKTLTPIIESSISMVFPDVDARDWMVREHAEVISMALMPDGKIHWTDKNVAKSANVSIA